jgi:hypothetical protein
VRRALALLAGSIALAAPTAAAAHRGSAGKGYVSTVAGILPNVLGVSASVVGGDDRLHLSNYSGKTIVILGYEGEPYLRLSRAGVYENTRSPATYLNRLRYPPSLHPGTADPRAAPRWRRVSRGLSFDWHDHRIHWTARTPPAVVRQGPHKTHLIFNWRVPGRADGKPIAITGFLGYVPPSRTKASGRGWVIPALAALGLAFALGLALVLLRRRRRGPARGGPSS